MENIDDLGSPWREHINNDLEELGEKDAIQPIEDIIKDRDEYKDKWLRAAADCQNIKKTMQKEYAESFDRGRISMLSTLLPAIDDLERAIQTSSDAEGIKLIHDKMMQLIESCSIEKICPEDGDDFNIDEHDALYIEETKDSELDGKICYTVLPGYKMTNSLVRNPIIRHAKVATWTKKN